MTCPVPRRYVGGTNAFKVALTFGGGRECVVPIAAVSAAAELSSSITRAQGGYVIW